MSDDDRMIAALAAIFAPDRASALAARLPAAVAADVSREAARLAAAARRERLDALAAAMAAPADPGRVSTAVRLERPSVSRVLRAVADGAGDAAAPLLVRLCRERIGR